MGVMKEQKEERESGRGESEWARDSWCWAAFDVFAGLELNVQLTEGKALFHGGNMKVTVLSGLKKKKRLRENKRAHICNNFSKDIHVCLQHFFYLQAWLCILLQTACFIFCPDKLCFIFSSCHSLVLWFMFRSVNGPHWVA